MGGGSRDLRGDNAREAQDVHHVAHIPVRTAWNSSSIVGVIVPVEKPQSFKEADWSEVDLFINRAAEESTKKKITNPPAPH